MLLMKPQPGDHLLVLMIAINYSNLYPLVFIESIILLLFCLGLRPGMPGAQPMTPAGLRPPAQAGFPQPDGTMQFNHQKARSPLMENSQATQLRNGEHNSTDSNFKAESETDNKVYI